MCIAFNGPAEREGFYYLRFQQVAMMLTDSDVS